MENNKYDIIKVFPPIRVWGTVGFIVAMWTVDLAGWKSNNMQLIFSSVSALFLGLYAFSIPACKPLRANNGSSLANKLGLDAFVLFKDRKMAIFFFFSMCLGAALQITNAFGGAFLDSFQSTFPDTFAVQHPILLLSISQISETLFILTIPFFLKKFGIKKVMLMSMFAWVFRFGLFSIGNPGSGLPFADSIDDHLRHGVRLLQHLRSLFVEKEAPQSMRASAQGLFMFMTNGIGAMIGGYGSGLVVDHYTLNGVSDWPSIWMVFTIYALILGLIFPFAFKYKHETGAVTEVRH